MYKLQKLLRLLTKKPSFSFIKSRLKNAGKIKKVKEIIANELGVNVNSLKAKVKNIEHHKAHLASSFFVVLGFIVMILSYVLAKIYKKG